MVTQSDPKYTQRPINWKNVDKIRRVMWLLRQEFKFSEMAMAWLETFIEYKKSKKITQPEAGPIMRNLHVLMVDLETLEINKKL